MILLKGSSLDQSLELHAVALPPKVAVTARPDCSILRQLPPSRGMEPGRPWGPFLADRPAPLTANLERRRDSLFEQLEILTNVEVGSHQDDPLLCPLEAVARHGDKVRKPTPKVGDSEKPLASDEVRCVMSLMTSVTSILAPSSGAAVAATVTCPNREGPTGTGVAGTGVAGTAGATGDDDLLQPGKASCKTIATATAVFRYWFIFLPTQSGSSL